MFIFWYDIGGTDNTLILLAELAGLVNRFSFTLVDCLACLDGHASLYEWSPLTFYWLCLSVTGYWKRNLLWRVQSPAQRSDFKMSESGTVTSSRNP